MTLTKATPAKVIAALAVGFAMAFSFAMPAHALTQAEATAIITALGLTGSQAAVIQALVTGASTPTSSSCSFTRDLTVGVSGADVTCLQNALIAKGYSIPAGATGYFGSQTKAAVMAWQAAAGVSPAAGYFGPKSRAAFGSTSSTPTTPTPGTGLAVAAGVQPPNALAPQGATRVPFTRITLTAGTDGPVTVSGIVVQRTGLGQDAAFNGVVLIDESTGMQVGNSKTFNSNHQATIGDTFTIPAGTSRSYLVAGNMISSGMSSYSGQAPSISVVNVNTTANVSGSFPIVGASQTLNSTLTVGTMTVAASQAYATNANATKEIGTTGFKTTGFTVTASSAEDITLKMLRFNQTGSASTLNDLANIKVGVGSQLFPATVSSDGKYVTADLGSGVVVSKGNQVEVYIQYDIVGSNSTNRTVIFDVDKNTDIFATGNTYNYGISPSVGSTAVPTSRSTANYTVGTSGTPFIYAIQVTISGASVTTISKANEVPAQNIALNVQNQPLGGFVADVKGEGMTVQSMVFDLATSTSAGSSSVWANYLVTNVTLVDENGSVVAGPVDAVDNTSGDNKQQVTFTDTVTIPTGRHVYTLRGKLNSSTPNGTTIVASTTPQSGWSNVKGATTGNTISLSGFGSVLMNTMTVQAGTMTISPAASLASQTVAPGSTMVEMGRFTFSASQSGEDLQFSTVPAFVTLGGGASASFINSCQLFNGSTALNTGSNVLNTISSGANTITLDNPQKVTKGSTLTLSLKCNVSGSASTGSTVTFLWVPGGNGTSFTNSFTVTGVGSNSSATLTSGSGTGATITINTGTFTITASPSAVAQPSMAIVAGGSTGVTVGSVKLHATNADVQLTKVALTLANGTYGTQATGAGNSSAGGAGDVLQAYLYNGSTMVGQVDFSTGTTSTSTLSGSGVLIPKDGDVILTIKADVGVVGFSGSAGIGDLVKIDPASAEGIAGGAVVQVGATAGVNGVKLVRTFPTVALGSGACTGNGCNGANQILKVFTVTANNSGTGVGLYQVKATIATSSAQVFDAKLYVYDQTGTLLSSTSYGSSAGQFGATACASGTGCTSTSPTLTFTGTIPVQIPAGATYTFKLLATVTPGSSATNWSVTTTINGDTAQTGLATSNAMANKTIATSTANVSPANFVWSDNATTTAATSDVDWFNGNQVVGLPSTGI